MVCNVLSREKLWYRKNWILFFDLWQLNFFFVACKIKKIKIVQIKKEKGIKKNCNFSSSLFSSLFNKLINLESFEFLLFLSRHLSIKKKVAIERHFINQWTSVILGNSFLNFVPRRNFSRRVDKTQGNNRRAGSSRYLPRSRKPLCFRMDGTI